MLHKVRDFLFVDHGSFYLGNYSTMHRDNRMGPMKRTLCGLRTKNDICAYLVVQYRQWQTRKTAIWFCVHFSETRHNPSRQIWSQFCEAISLELAFRSSISNKCLRICNFPLMFQLAEPSVKASALSQSKIVLTPLQATRYSHLYLSFAFDDLFAQR